MQDIPRLTTTKTGWALTPANDTIKRHLLQPDNVETMLETLGAVGYQLPEKWISYAVQRVEAALVALRIGGDAAVQKIADCDPASWDAPASLACGRLH